MFNLKRSALALTPIVTAALVAVVALSSTPSGAAALRIATERLGVTAQAAGGGGGAGIDALTISQGSLVARLAVSVTVTYMCRPVFDPNTFPTGVPFRKGPALASVSVFACPNTFVASGVLPPCDFGSAGPLVISIK